MKSTPLPAKLLSPLTECASRPREADNVFAGAESGVILLSSPATGQSGVGGLSCGSGAEVKDSTGKSLKLQNARSIKALTTLDGT